MPELILQSGRRAGQRLTLPAGEVVIGRDEGCRLRLTSADVSRRHCLLRVSDHEVLVVDLGSRNKTYINDQAVEAPVALRPGDRLRVGPFVFEMPGGPADPSASDDDVASWLTDEGSAAPGGAPALGSDTAFINRGSAKPDADTTELRLSAGGVVAPSPPPAGPAASAPPPAQPAAPLDPIVGQAAEVIRAYWAAKKG